MQQSDRDLQQALIAQLRADPGLIALIAGRAYDAPPQEVAFPFVSLGPWTGEPWDGHDLSGWEGRVQIDSWSRARGQAEALAIQAAIVAALHDRPVPLATQAHVLFRLEFSTTRTDPDRITTHGLQRFRFLTHA